MIITTLESRNGKVVPLAEPATRRPSPGTDGWVWIDVQLEDGDRAEDLDGLVAGYGLDALALDDALEEFDLPKVNDFGDHILVILHGLTDEQVATYEIDCFFTSTSLLTIHRESSPSIKAFSARVQKSDVLASGGPSDVLARLADVMTRRYIVLGDFLDQQLDELTERALVADSSFLEDLTLIRREVGDVRSVLRPQREVFDVLQRSPSPLISESAKRRFTDVYDLAVRSVHEFESARTVMSEALGAYQGAEARAATEITKVLTLYAAIMLPLSLLAGFFGMNFVDLPGANDADGWKWALGAMVAVAVVSLGAFLSAGWMRLRFRRPLPQASVLLEAVRLPAKMASGLYEVATKPIRKLQ